MDPVLGDIIKLTLQTVTAVIVAWLAYRTAALGREVRQVRAQTDGMKDQLIAEVRAGSRAQGNREGRDEIKDEAFDTEGGVAVVVKGTSVS